MTTNCYYFARTETTEKQIKKEKKTVLESQVSAQKTTSLQIRAGSEISGSGSRAARFWDAGIGPSPCRWTEVHSHSDSPGKAGSGPGFRARGSRAKDMRTQVEGLA